MESDKARRQVAEPAEEEIKKHGDPLKQQVAEALQQRQPQERQDDGKKPEGN